MDGWMNRWMDGWMDGHLCELLSLFLLASRNISDWWLSYWITKTHNESMSSSYSISDELVNSDQSRHDDLGFYLGIYGGLAGANTVSSLNMIHLITST